METDTSYSTGKKSTIDQIVAYPKFTHLSFEVQIFQEWLEFDLKPFALFICQTITILTLENMRLSQIVQRHNFLFRVINLEGGHETFGTLTPFLTLITYLDYKCTNITAITCKLNPHFAIYLRSSGKCLNFENTYKHDKLY